MQHQLNEIDAAIDELDQMIMSLPLQASVKRDLAAQLDSLWEELVQAADLRPTDFG